jgi:hypothetical protein
MPAERLLVFNLGGLLREPNCAGKTRLPAKGDQASRPRTSSSNCLAAVWSNTESFCTASI